MSWGNRNFGNVSWQYKPPNRRGSLQTDAEWVNFPRRTCVEIEKHFDMVSGGKPCVIEHEDVEYKIDFEEGRAVDTRNWHRWLPIQRHEGSVQASPSSAMSAPSASTPSNSALHFPPTPTNQETESGGARVPKPVAEARADQVRGKAEPESPPRPSTRQRQIESDSSPEPTAHFAPSPVAHNHPTHQYSHPTSHTHPHAPASPPSPQPRSQPFKEEPRGGYHQHSPQPISRFQEPEDEEDDHPDDSMDRWSGSPQVAAGPPVHCKLYLSRTSVTCIAPWILLCEGNVIHDLMDVDMAAGENKRTEFLRLSPKGNVPAMLDEDGTAVWESHAILRYICYDYTLPDHWYPKDPKQRARVDAALDWRHTSFYPNVTKLTNPMLSPGSSCSNPDAAEKAILEDLMLLETYFLPEGGYIAGEGAEGPSIADLVVALLVNLLGVCKQIRLPVAVRSYRSRVMRACEHWDRCTKALNETIAKASG